MCIRVPAQRSVGWWVQSCVHSVSATVLTICKANNFQSKGDSRWIMRAATGIRKYIHMRERNSAGEHKNDIQENVLGTPMGLRYTRWTRRARSHYGRVVCHTRWRHQQKYLEGRTFVTGQRIQEAEKEAEIGNWVGGGRNIVEMLKACRARTTLINYSLHITWKWRQHNKSRRTRQEPHQLTVSYLYICDEGKCKEPGRWYILHISG